MAAHRRKRLASDHDPLEERISEELKDQVKTAQADEAAHLVDAFSPPLQGTERPLEVVGPDDTILPPGQLQNEQAESPATGSPVVVPPLASSDAYQAFWLCLDRTNRRQVNVRLPPEVADILKAHTEFLQQIAGSPREIDNGVVLSLFLLAIDKCLNALAPDWQDRVRTYKALNPRRPDGAFWAMADLMAKLIRKAGLNSLTEDGTT